MSSSYSMRTMERSHSPSLKVRHATYKSQTDRSSCKGLHSHALLSFLVLSVSGVTFVGDGSVGATHTELTGSLAAVNGALSSLLFGPYSNFFGYASIEWHLSNDGSSLVNPTNGTLSIVVGSINIVPILVPLDPSGVLAGFTMTELTTSPSFPGVAVSDGSGTSQTIYKVTIQMFEGTLHLATDFGLTITTNTNSLMEFTCLPDALNAALASFTFKSSAYGAYGGNAGFVIVVANTFHKTSGFIQASITNVPALPQPIAGVLPPPVITGAVEAGRMEPGREPTGTDELHRADCDRHRWSMVHCLLGSTSHHLDDRPQPCGPVLRASVRRERWWSR
jgi:hypothetical protein